MSRVIYVDSLSHHGVKGMKWGVRKETYSERTGAGQKIQSARTAQQEYRAANKAYSKSFNKAYGFTSRHPISQFVKKSKNYDKSNKLWEDAYDKASAVNSAKKAKKQANKEARDYQRYKSPKDIGKVWMSRTDVYRQTYRAAKNATGLRNKAKAATNAYLNTPYRDIALFGSYQTTVKRNFTGRW